MPHIQVKLIEGKPEALKKELAEELVKTAERVLGNRNEAFSLSIEDFSSDEWKTKVYPKDIMEHKDILYKEPGYTM